MYFHQKFHNAISDVVILMTAALNLIDLLDNHPANWWTCQEWQGSSHAIYLVENRNNTWIMRIMLLCSVAVETPFQNPLFCLNKHLETRLRKRWIPGKNRWIMECPLEALTYISNKLPNDDGKWSIVNRLTQERKFLRHIWGVRSYCYYCYNSCKLENWDLN
jgi:hypothetical protein